MIITHFPDDANWQLLGTPLSRGEFLRQPMMRPSFFAEGMQLVAPTRSQTDVQDAATILIENPQQRWLIAQFGKKGTDPSIDCEVVQAVTTTISCPFPAPGTYAVNVFSSGQQYSTYQFVDALEFNKRGS
jgi:transglutaminase/protease-like cytokinesis protein 3